MILIVGLGNPGKKYENTRHNIGFMVVDELARKLLPAGGNPWKMNRKFNSQLLITNYQLRQIILAKPQTMMNASGFAVQTLITNYQLPITNLWVIHDDLDLPLGKIKIVKNRGSAGHHGVDSIIEALKSADFVRIRVGIGYGGKISVREKPREIEDWVLKNFEGKEAVEANKAVQKAKEIIEFALKNGLDKAMNYYHAK